MIVIFSLSDEERVKAIDGFEFEMVIIRLYNSSFEIIIYESIKIFKFSEKLKDTLMTDFSNGNLDASKIKNHLTE